MQTHNIRFIIFFSKTQAYLLYLLTTIKLVNIAALNFIVRHLMDQTCKHSHLILLVLSLCQAGNFLNYPHILKTWIGRLPTPVEECARPYLVEWLVDMSVPENTQVCGLYIYGKCQLLSCTHTRTHAHTCININLHMHT